MFKSARIDSADNDMLWKGLVCAAIGLAVLLSPYFLKSPALLEAVSGSALVGWFALVLGCAFIGQYLLRRRKAIRRGQSAPD